MRDCRCGTCRQVEEREGWLRRTVMVPLLVFTMKAVELAGYVVAVAYIRGVDLY